MIMQCAWCRKDAADDDAYIHSKKNKKGNLRHIRYHKDCWKRKQGFQKREARVTQRRVKNPLGNMTQ